MIDNHIIGNQYGKCFPKADRRKIILNAGYRSFMDKHNCVMDVNEVY